MSITMTTQQRKAIRKVTEALQANYLGISFGELMQKTGLSKASLTKSLSVIDGVTEENGVYIMPIANSADGENMQDDSSNTQSTSINPPDNEATVINPNTGREYIEMPETRSVITQQILAQISQSEDTPAEAPRNKPFTPNPITGYQVQKGKAKIFLNRKATSKTLTLTIEDLEELVNAVKKSERVA